MRAVALDPDLDFPAQTHTSTSFLTCELAPGVAEVQFFEATSEAGGGGAKPTKFKVKEKKEASEGTGCLCMGGSEVEVLADLDCTNPPQALLPSEWLALMSP